MHCFRRALILITVFLFATCSSFSAEVRVFSDAKDAITANLKLFENATGETFYGSVYTFKTDQSGLMRLALLRDAARRGNKVYLLVDDFANKISPAIAQYLQSEGVHIYVYNKQKILKPKTWFNRNHEKIWTNGKTFIVSDMNEGNKYYGPNARNRSKGLGMVIHGPQARDAFEHEKKLFSSKYTSPLSTNKAFPEELTAAKAKIDEAAKQLQKLKTVPDNEWKRGFQAVDDDKLRFVHDEEYKSKLNSESTSAEFLAMIEDAKAGEKLVIVSPYLIFTKQQMKALRAARERGVNIKLLTNSGASNNQRLAHLGYVSQRDSLIRMGIDVKESRGTQLLHAKGAALLSAGENPVPRRAFVGSLQAHERADLDLETIAVTEDPALATRIYDELGSMLENSVLASGPPREKINAAARCVINCLLRIGIAPIRKQL